MAIIDVVRLRSLEYSEAKGQKGSIDLQGSIELLAKFDSEVDFDLLVNDINNWPGLSGDPIPQIGDDAQIGGIDFYVTSRKFSYWKGDEQERAAKIVVTYDRKAEDPDDEKPEDTDNETWHKITVTTEQQQVPLTDEGADGLKGGQPARNSAGDPVDGLTENRCLVKLTYTNTQVEDPDFEVLLSFVNTTNDADFLGCASRTLLCQGFNADYDDKREVWNISVEWIYDPKQHIVEYYDVGFNELVGGVRRAILDIYNNPVSKPVPLDGAGAAIPVSQLTAYGPSENNPNLVTLTAYPYHEKTMANIFTDARI